MTYFKDLTDTGLAESIKSYQDLLAVAGETGLHVFKIAKALDIQVAIKRQRIKAGTWNPATAPVKDCACCGMRDYLDARGDCSFCDGTQVCCFN